MRPEEQQALYQQTLALHEAGQLEEAARGYATLLDLHPDGDLLLYNFGLLQFSRKRYHQAAELFSRAAALCPESADYRYNLGLALKRAGRLAEAEQAYLEAGRLAPDDLDVQYNLAGCYKDAGRLEEAIRLYRQVLDRDSDHCAALNNMAYLYHRLGEYSRAASLYRRLLRLRPDDQGVAYMLASLEGRTMAGPPKTYISELFDQYAGRFEQDLLSTLDYRVPALLQELFTRFEGRKSCYARMLDLGCGTGLAGEVFRPFCRFMAGVDLSARMIDQARKKSLYDVLAVADIIDYLTDVSPKSDLLVAADVLTYLGDLEPLFAALDPVAQPGGLFCFSTEHGADRPFRLQATGRFSHDPVYVTSLARKYGWQVQQVKRAGLRREAGKWITGEVFLLRRNEG